MYLLASVATDEVDPTLPPPEEQPKRVFDITHPNVVHRYLATAIDFETGRVVWTQELARRVPPEGTHGDNDFASATPIVDSGRLYCWLGSAGLCCLDATTGELIWDRDLGTVRIGASLGEGASPALGDGTLVVVRDHAGPSSIVAIDAATGQTIWTRDRDEPNAWATPVIADRDESRRQVITAASNRVRSYDLASGETLWEAVGLTGNVTPTPIVFGRRVFCMSGYQGYAVLALPIDQSGTVRPIWQTDTSAPYVPSPLLLDGLLYVPQSNRGILSVCRSSDGQPILDRTRIPGVPQLYASPVAAVGRVYFVGRSGQTTVVQAIDPDRPELRVLARNQLDDRFDASPTIAGDSLILRGERFVYRLAAPPEVDPAARQHPTGE